MARQVLTGATVLTMNPRRDVLSDAAVVVNGPVISYVGPAPEVRTEPGDTRIDCRGLLLMPGLINAHTHTAMGMFRGLAEDEPRDGWAQARYGLPYLGRMRPDDYRHGALLGALEMLTNGVTTVADRGSFMDVMAEALHAAGIRAVVAHTLFDIDRPLEFEQARRLLDRWGTDANARVHAGIGPHAPDTCSDGLLRRVRALAAETGARVFVHCAQSQLELAALRARGYAGAVRCLGAHGLLGPDVVTAHCLYVDADEIGLLAGSGTWVAHCPASNAKIEARVAPVGAMARAGVRLALGTDWAATNNGMDLFDEMKTAGLLGKVAAGDTAVLPAARLLEMATIDGARALGLDEIAGSLEPGKHADIVALAADELHLQPWHDVAANLAYSAKGQDVRHVWVDGRRIIQDRRPAHVDVPALLEETASIWRRLKTGTA